jgi:hypothetical protein
MPRQPYKTWPENQDKLKDDLDAVCKGQDPGEYYAVIVKVDPKHNPISGYWTLNPPVKVPASDS